MLSDADFVGSEGIVERQVVLGDGESHALWFRQLPNTEWKRYYMWLASEDEEVRAAAEAKLVAKALCDAEGQSVLTPEQAVQLKVPVLGRLMKAIRIVNGLEDQPGNA